MTTLLLMGGVALVGGTSQLALALMIVIVTTFTFAVRKYNDGPWAKAAHDAVLLTGIVILGLIAPPWKSPEFLLALGIAIPCFAMLVAAIRAVSFMSAFGSYAEMRNYLGMMKSSTQNARWRPSKRTDWPGVSVAASIMSLLIIACLMFGHLYIKGGGGGKDHCLEYDLFIQVNEDGNLARKEKLVLAFDWRDESDLTRDIDGKLLPWQKQLDPLSFIEKRGYHDWRLEAMNLVGNSSSDVWGILRRVGNSSSDVVMGRKFKMSNLPGTAPRLT